jgi:hypothetical protein
MRRTGITLLLLLLVAPLSAQVPVVLTREAFVRLVLENHPMARQAALRPELGAMAVRSARGGFDPMATVDYDEKLYDDKTYFQLFDAGLKVPTWFGVELFAGFQENSGDLLDPQAFTPSDGLLKVGGQLSLGQGLFIDQRRATLRRSEAYLRATQAERIQMLNDLLLQALSDHTDWVAAYRALEVSNNAVTLATIRLDAIRGSWRGGDRAAIDTLEAYLQVQDRQMRQQQADLAFRNAGLRLSDHLWDADQRPLELQPANTSSPSSTSSTNGWAMAARPTTRRTSPCSAKATSSAWASRCRSSCAANAVNCRWPSCASPMPTWAWSATACASATASTPASTTSPCSARRCSWAVRWW